MAVYLNEQAAEANVSGKKARNIPIGPALLKADVNRLGDIPRLFPSKEVKGIVTKPYVSLEKEMGFEIFKIEVPFNIKT